MIQLFQPSLGEEELAALRQVFASSWVGKGEHVLQFEREFAKSLGVDVKHFTSTNSCTEGLFLAADVFRFGPGDEVIVPSISFIAVGNAVVSTGARLVLCDVDRRTLNTNAELIERCITPRTKAVILNHYGGVPCDMDPILDLCRPRRIAVIEDSACAPRSFYRGRAAGTIGDMGTWSFDAMKIICTGDGGMLYFRDPDMTVEAKERLYLGLPNRQTSGMDSSAQGASAWWEYDVNRPGRRAIMNNIAGAVGCVQMQKLPAFLERRRLVAETYSRKFADLGWLEPPPPLPKDCQTSHYFFWVQLAARNELAHFLRGKGIYSTFRYWPLHRVSYFKLEATSLPNSDAASALTLNLPLHQALSDDDVGRVIDAVEAFGRARGI